MIRINLLRNRTAPAGGDRALIPRREAIAAAVLLGVAIGVLLYLASRPKQGEPAPAPGVQAGAGALPVPAAAPAPKAEPKPEPEAAPPSPGPLRAGRLEAEQAQPAETTLPPTPAPPAAPEGCAVTGLTVQQSGDELTVLIQTGAPARHRTFELRSPSRIVVDLAGCRNALPADQSLQHVQHPLLQRVRASQFSADPRVFRVVLDAASIPRYEVRALNHAVEIRVLGGRP